MQRIPFPVIAALNGPLHGGANERVIQMLEEIGGRAFAREYTGVIITETVRADVPGLPRQGQFAQ